LKRITFVVFVLRACNAAVIVLAALALFQATRYAFADWLATSAVESSVLRATTLVPDNTAAWLRLADLRSTSDEDAVGPLRRALKSSPEDAHIWIQLGLELEGRRDLAEAERCLTRAVELDRDFIPIWTLTNYYFRRGDTVRFFPAARRTLAYSRGDLNPLFRMCWSITDDGAVILRDAIPDRDDVLSAYLQWLDGQLDAAAPVAKRLLDRYPEQGTPALLGYCDRLVSGQRLDAAVALWNQMSGRGLIKAGPVQPDQIVDGSFRFPPLDTAFDWRASSPPGVDIAAGGSSLNLSFSGTQPDHCDVVNQLVLLHPDRTYRLRYHFESSGLEAGAGLHWIAGDARSGARFAPPLSQFRLTPGDFAMAQAGDGDYTFIVPPSSASHAPVLARIALVYDRVPASATMQGWIRVERVWLEEAK
jgi:tetratricopeptide (TPR) repeat protein